MIRAAVCIAIVACIAQVHCTYLNSYDNVNYDTTYGGGRATIRVGHSGGSMGGGHAKVLIASGGSRGFSSGGNVVNVGGGTVASAPVRVNCPQHGPQRIHVRAGHQGRPNVRVVRPSNPEPVTVNCPNHAGQNIIVHGAPAPRPIITVDRHSGSGFGGGFVSSSRHGGAFVHGGGHVRQAAIIDIDSDSSDSGSVDIVDGGYGGGYDTGFAGGYY